VTGFQNVAIAVASLAGAQGTALCVGYLADHTKDIAAGWAEGCAWVTARRRQVRAAWVATAAVRRAVALLVLCLVLRAHGQHRRGAGVA
jgi:hypothetical protein